MEKTEKKTKNIPKAMGRKLSMMESLYKTAEKFLDERDRVGTQILKLFGYEVGNVVSQEDNFPNIIFTNRAISKKDKLIIEKMEVCWGQWAVEHFPQNKERNREDVNKIFIKLYLSKYTNAKVVPKTEGMVLVDVDLLEW